MRQHWSSNPKLIQFAPLLIALVFIVACGGAASEPTAPAAAAPAASQPTGDTAVAAATTPAEVMAPKVHPGKLNVMLGDLAAERFDDIYAPGATGGLNYLRLMGGYLISGNDKSELVPGIASGWRVSEDGLTWTFDIRNGVKFHDGSELTPEDVLWSINHYTGPQANDYLLLSSKYPANTTSIELSGPNEITWVLTKVFMDVPNSYAEGPAGGRHIMPKRAELNDKQAALDYDKNPIAAGLMRLVSHTPAEVMRFERFDDFYYQPENGFPEDKRVNFQFLDMYIVPEEAVRVAALRAGEADIVPSSLATKSQVEAGGGRMVFGPEGIITDARFVDCWPGGFDLWPKDAAGFPNCHDKRVRQALQLALNRVVIRDQLYGGPEVFQIKGWWRATPSNNAYTPELDNLTPFDPDKARQLLADAGYPGGEGFGKLIVNTSPSTSLPLLVEQAQLGADMWRRELGLDVEVRVGDRTAIKKAVRDKELIGQVIWQDNETRADVTGSYTYFYGDRAITNNLQNSLHDDQQLLDLVHAAIEILDSGDRAEALKKLTLTLADESYHFNVGYVNIPWGVGPKVLTWEPYALATYPSGLHTVTLK